MEKYGTEKTGELSKSKKNQLYWILIFLLKDDVNGLHLTATAECEPVSF